MAYTESLKNLFKTKTASGSLVLLLAAALMPALWCANASAQTPRPSPQTPPPSPVQTPPAPSRMNVSPGQRGQSGQGSQYGQPGFVGEPINLNVVNADIRDILNYITEQYGVNFVIDKSVKGVPVTVNVTDVPWNVALDALLRANELGVEVQGNILRVATAETLAKEARIQAIIKESQLDNAPLVTEIIRLNYARAAGTLSGAAGDTANFSGGTPSFTTTGLTTATGTGANTNTGGGQITGGGLLPIIKRRLSRRGSVEIDERSNTLLITDVKQNIDAIRQLVTLLDQPEPQVEIETRIVIATRNFSRDLGVQLQAAVFGKNGKGISFETATAAAGLNPRGLPGGLTNTPPAVNSLQVPNPGTVIGLTTGIFGTAQIGALITAAEQKGEAKTIAQPRVTALNNRPAQIETGEQIAITTAQAGATAATGGAALFTTTYVNVPLRLSVTPQITDAGTVLMKVTAENNTVDRTIASTGAPPIATQRMETEVLVPDGGTTVVGGTLLDNESDTVFRTPGLGTLPVVGNLFKRKQVVRQTNEILFFITPRIYRPDYQGNPTATAPANGTRTIQIPQPVPLGNPPSNSSPTQPTTPTQAAPENGAQPSGTVTPQSPAAPGAQQ